MNRLLLLSLLFATTATAQEGFKPLFNGKDLSGWDGNPELWSVEDGCITGKTTGPEQLKYNQFLIWRGGKVKNFELRVKVKQAGNNTGIQYRSREFPETGKWSVGGYQCDIHPAAPNNAMVYGEKWGGILVQNGQSMVIDPDGAKWLKAEHEPVEVDIAEWHEYTIIAQGNHLVHKIDGQQTIDLLDFGAKTQLLEGIVAFQIHRGPAMKVQIKDVLLKELPEGGVVSFDKSIIANAKPLEAKAKGKPQPKAEAATPPTGGSAAANAEWKWLWSDAPTAKDAARLKKEFDLGEAAIKSAVLRVSCDNGAQVFLNGELVLTNPDWQRPTQANVTQKLKRGKNELRSEATNKGSAAGFLAVLSVTFADGKEQSLFTDASWLAAAPNTEEWKPAKVVNTYGKKPYGEIFSKDRTKNPAAVSDEVTAPADIKALPGFKVELIYKVTKDNEGSWVGMTVDDKGRILATDQYGGLFRLTPPPVGSGDKAQVEKLNAEINGAHGLLYAFDSLYALVNEKPNVAGLYRLRDTKGTGQFDEKVLLREIKGQGEHGNHSITLSPDGKSLYLSCGNGTAQPQIEHTRGSRPFADDQIVPRTSKGAEFSDTEPQAFTLKVSPDGKRFEMIADGMRNHFDSAFNALGDLFTYDSDMEWDAGMPWYRPTRIYHLVSGGDYGFRESSGKLMGYCPDIVPPLVEVGPGCPTGVVSGLGAAFPAKYQHAIYACDWTYGTLYAVHLTPKGAGYEAKLEEFIYGKPLPLTDAVIGKDGAMYFTIGGRRTQSAMYRVTYEGRESTAPAAAPAETMEHKLRVELEHLHEEGTGPEAIDKAWPYLGHADRLVRYAARVSIERQPAKLWAARALKQTEPWAVIESGLALARFGGKDNQPALLAMLNALDFAKLDPAQQIALVRVYEVTVSRSGLPEGDSLVQTIARLDAVFPAKTNDLNRELSRTLAALGSKEVVAKTLKLMRTAKDDPVSWLSVERMARNDRYGPNFLRSGEARPNQQQIAYAYGLRFTKEGWTPELRREFFAWFASTGPWQGGNQFRGFLDTIRMDALASVPEAKERAQLATLAIPKVQNAVPAVIHPPKGPGKNYSIDEVVAFARNAKSGRNFERGHELFIAAACQACHRLGNEGGGVGPDLTGAGNRYTLRDLLENIIDPSKVISDQYESSVITLRNGSTVVGRITGEEGGFLQVATNPAAPGEITEVRSDKIQSRTVSPVSLMPPGLINSMNQDEVEDLLAYILSGGDKRNKMFKK
ncbi:family 16 glycoside hydrolase [Prosthecobacter sp.]|uniref:family 16 glycoside hydrolase n=1 Tax=Prosthecobacter sp. TaxID=1965333 RepID=UPI0037849A60